MPSEDLRQKLGAMIAEAESPRERAVDVMLEIQEHHLWMSDDAMEEAAGLLGMTPLELDELATFYDFIYRSPVGKYVIHVCDSAMCWLQGHSPLPQPLPPGEGSYSLPQPFAQVAGNHSLPQGAGDRGAGRHASAQGAGTGVKVMDYISARVSAPVGGTSPDGLFTLLPVCCIGYCDRAPAMVVNRRVYGNLTPEKIDAILDKLARENEFHPPE